MRIITPNNDFPDPDVTNVAGTLGLTQVNDTVGRKDVIQELAFEAEDGTSVKYLQEPELKIPVIVFEGPSAEPLREDFADEIGNIDAFAASVGYDADASEDVKVHLLRLLSAHTLEVTTPAIARVARLAARDPSPAVRRGVAQLLQYAHEETIAGIVRTIANDEDADVRELAKKALARFDAAPDAK